MVLVAVVITLVVYRDVVNSCKMISNIAKRQLWRGGGRGGGGVGGGGEGREGSGEGKRSVDSIRLEKGKAKVVLTSKPVVLGVSTCLISVTPE